MLEQDILSHCSIRDTGWVEINLTWHMPYRLLQRCVDSVMWNFAWVYDDPILAVVTPPSRGPVLAGPTAFCLNVDLIYPRRDPFQDQKRQEAVPVSIPSPSHNGQPMDIWLPKAAPFTPCRYLFGDDVLRRGVTSSLLIQNINRLWGWECVGAFFLIEIAGKGGRQRIREVLSPNTMILSLAKVGVNA